MLYGLDVSVYNNYVPGNEDFVNVKIGGGDAGLYYDTKANYNYNTARNAGKITGGYWFAGGNSPQSEADFFVQGMKPFNEYDLFELDWEINISDPVAWCQAFLNQVYVQTGVHPLIYMDISRVNSYNWTPVLQTSGLWLAAPSIPYNANAPVNVTYVMQQGPVVNGIDQDVFFGTREELQAYGYHAPVAPVVVSTPEPVQSTTPVVKPITTTPTQVTTPIVKTSIAPEPVINNTKTTLNKPSNTGSVSTFVPSTPPITPHYNVSTGFWVSLWNWFLRFLGIK